MQLQNSRLKTNSRPMETQQSFGQIFNERLSENTVKRFQETPQPVAPPALPPLINQTLYHFESIESSLTHLESYQSMLADPKVSLRTMEPNIDAIKKDANHLEELLDGMKDEEQIKPLVKETVLVLNKEIARFERGDYVE